MTYALHYLFILTLSKPPNHNHSRGVFTHFMHVSSDMEVALNGSSFIIEIQENSRNHTKIKT